jgi:response regulator NasT
MNLRRSHLPPDGLRAKGMRVLVIDPDPARAALVAEGLAGVQPLEVRRAAVFDEREAAAFAPDVVVIAADSPDRDTLESLREAGQHNPRPVVMFVDRSEPGLAEQAVRAGVAAYVVDGLAPGRVRSILDVAMSRFALTQQLQGDLAKAKADLESRKTVERAKGLLMKERGLDEDGAYRLLRKLAMDRGKPIGQIAADLLAFAGVLKGDAS